MSRHAPNAYEQHLMRTRDMIARRQEREASKRPYQRLPDGHPDYDAEDLPHWWQRFLAEIVGGVILGAIIFAVAVMSQPLGPILPDFLDWLTRLLT